MSNPQKISSESQALLAAQNDSERLQVFQELKPRCIALSRCILTSSPNNRELTAALAELYPTLQNAAQERLDEKLGDYVFFPLSHVFRRYRELNDHSLELALLCLEVLICTCWRVNISAEMGKQLLILLTFVIGGNPNVEEQQQEEGNRSEETKLAGCRCLLNLFGSFVRSGGAAVIGEADSIPAVGHTVTTLLTTFSEADMLELQIVSLQAMDKLLLETVKDEDMRASFYPGVVSGVVRALGLGKTTKRPYQVLKDMVKLLERLISRVLDDVRVFNLPDAEASDTESVGIRRTKSWLKATAANTKVSLEQVLKLRTHPKIEVRTAVLQLSLQLLELCSSSLDEATMILVETLVVIAGNEDESLASLAGNSIRVMASMEGKVKDAVRECLDAWIAGLPRVMTGNNEDAKQRVITRLSVAFGLCMELNMESDILRDMLADGIKESLLAAKAPENAGTTLVRATPVRPKLEMLLADHTTSGGRIAKFQDVIVGQRSQMGTMESMKRLLGALRLSSEENGMALAQRHLRDAGARGLSVNERAVSFWIAINLLRGSVSAGNEVDMYLDFGLLEPSILQRHVTDELLALALENLITTNQDEAESVENAPLHCLALEALSLVAETQKREFRGELVDALYPVVHNLGSSSAEVQNHSIVALNNIAASCEYSSAKELLLDNVDYMVNAVSLKLNIFDLSPQAPIVLNMMLKLVGPKLVPHLDDLVVSMFSILDGFHEYEKLCEELFVVLASIVKESSKGDPDVKRIEFDGETMGGNRRKKRRILKDNEFILFLKEYRDENRPRLEPLDSLPVDEEEMDGDEADGKFPRKPWGKGKGKDKDNPLSSPAPDDNEGKDEDGPPPPPPEEESPPPSKTYDIVQRITRLSQHYLTHGSFSLRAKVLHLIKDSTSTLSMNEREYLPVINDIWPMVYARLHDPEPGVVIQACQAISGIAETSGDFLASRVRDGLPGIFKVYNHAWANLVKERRGGSGGMGVYGTGYKLWDAVVKMLTALVEHVGVSDEVLDKVCDMCGAEVLREREDLRSALEEAAPDTVWLVLESSKMEERKWEERMPVGFVVPVF
ncbi:armadillo-type protein [Tricharina praecox]|uniref:armadillo-type protein n=1 Tax=Tricharina praecox TaxID=43433 RepID=UPI00221E75F5|nr:armadillo-type protein [Tricharina praecox]KAI5853859.1 armadillo-type protein [Tricharina praecox]